MLKNIFKYNLLGILLCLAFSFQFLFAQLSGVKTIPGDYATIQAAVADLNTQGVGTGGVTFNVTAGHTESLTDTSITITATGTTGNEILFQKSGVGANPIVTRTDVGVLNTTSIGAEGDAVFRLVGTDYITFDGIDVAADSQGIEYGYHTHKPDGDNGSQYVTIKNCVITMNAGDNYVVGINIGNGALTTSSATGVTVTSAAGMNTNITITGNTIQNVLCGMYFRGSTAMYDTDYIVGDVGAGNIIQNFSGGRVTSTYGMYFIYVNSPNVQYNTIDNSATPHTSTLYSVMFSIVTGDAVCSNNDMTLSNAASSSSTYYIYSASNTCDSEIFEYNTFAAVDTLPSGSLYFIYSTGSTPIKTVNGNTTSGSFIKTGGGTYCWYNSSSPTSGLETVTDNTFSNIEVLSGSSTFYGIYSNTGSGQSRIMTGNTMSNVNSSSTGSHYAIYATTAGNSQVSGNTVSNFTGGGTVYGLYMGGATANIYNNAVAGLTSTTTSTSSYCYGAYSTTGTDVTWYNNFFSDIKAPGAASTSAGTRGFYVSSGTNVNLYYNTLYLDYTGDAGNSSTALYATTSTTSLDLRNNIFVNNVDNSAGGAAWAFRGSGTAVLTDLAATTNNNLYYAGTPSASNLLYYDGTNSAQTLTEYKNLVAPLETASVSSNPPFVNVATTPYDLHMSTTIPTQTESGGTPVTGITDDFDGDTRNATTPDIGADEFNGIGADLTPPTIAYNLLYNQGVNLTSVSLTAEITDASGIATGSNAPRLYIKKTTDVSYVYDDAPSVSGDDYTFIINYTAIGGISIGDTIQYYVAAEDVNGNAATNPAGGVGSSPPGTTPPPTVNTYLVVDVALSGVYTVGLNDFIQKTGKQVYFETRTRTVTKNTNGEDAMVDINTVDGETKTEILNPDLAPKYVTVTETYKELMENGKPFDRNFYRESIDGVYPTLTEAVNDLNVRGVSGPVTFSLVDTYYPSETYPILITDFGGSSSTNTVTIKPAAGIQAEIPGDPSQGGSTIQLGFADNIIIDGSNNGTTSKDLKIVSLISGSVPAIHLYGDASNNVMKNLIAESQNTSTGSGTIIFGTGGYDCDNNLIQNCTVKPIDTIATRPGVGVYFFSSQTGDGNQVVGCDIYDFDDYGIRLQGAPLTNTLVSGCDVYMTDDVSTSTTYGIYISRCDGLIVEKSKFRDLAGGSTIKGAYILGSSTSGDFIFRNNFFSPAFNTNSSSAYAGLDYFAFSANSFEAYNNSIYLTGGGVSGSSTTYALTKRDAATIYKAYNNAVYNGRSNGAGTGKHYAVYVSNTTATTFEMDYNDYYADGAGGVMGYYSSTDYNDLTSWQTASGMDANSVSGNPGFTSNNDLHINPGYNTLDGKAIYFASVPDDIDGDARNMTTPDIGADEYTYVPPSVLDPTDVSATVISDTQIDVAFTPNASNNNVVIVFNLDGSFTTPSGTPPAPGNPFAGGTLLVNSTTSPYNHIGLMGTTTYYYKLFSYDGTDYSNGVTANATTPCSISAEFSENFDGVSTPALPDCWAKVGSGGSANTQTTNPNSAPNCLYIYSSSTSSQAIVSMPPVSNAGAGTHWLKFFARGNFSAGGYLEIGYLTDPLDPMTFVAVDTAFVNSLVYELYTANLGTAPGANQYLAIRNTGSPAYSILVDDVIWESVPTCQQPIDLTATGITQTSAVLGWTEVGTATAWDIEYGETPFVPTGTPTVSGVTNPYNLMGLTAATGYAYYVRSSCGGGEFSAWSGPLEFTTNCALVVAPWTEDFEGGIFPPPCWSLGTDPLGGQLWKSSNDLAPGISGNGVGSYSAWADFWGVGDGHNQDLISLSFDASSLTSPQLVFDWAYQEYLFANDTLYISYSTDDGSTWTLLATGYDLASGTGYFNLITAANMSGEYGGSTNPVQNSDWSTLGLTLPAGTNRVKFNAASDFGNNLFLDNIKVQEAPAHDIGVSELAFDLGTMKESYVRTGISRQMEEAMVDKNGNRIENVSIRIVYPETINNSPEATANLLAIVENYGGQETSYQVGWQIDGSPQTPVNNTDVLEAGDVDTLTLNWAAATGGFHSARAWTILAGDVNPANDSSNVLSFYVQPDNSVFLERFESAFPPAGWLDVDADGSGISWFAGNPSVFPALELNGYAAANYQGANANNVIDQWLISPNTGGLSAAAETDSLVFYVRTPDGSIWPDSVEIRVSTTGTNTSDFTTLLDYIMVPINGEWNRFAYALPSAANRYIAFRYLIYDAITNSNYVGIDLVEVLRYSTSNTFQLSVDVSNGWNMVSIPGLNSPDQNVNTWWPLRDMGANVFRYASGYQSVTDAVPGTGYWMKHSGANTYNTGDEWPAGGIQIVAHDPIAGSTGWNLFGGYEIAATAANVTTNPPGLQSGPIYQYSGGYQTATSLDPGYGYWIKLTGAGDIIIPEALAKGQEPKEWFPEDWGRIVMTDAEGRSYTLYLVKGEVDLNQYEMPPAPPAGMFDIRFSSGRIAEDINSSIKTIDMSGVTYPLTVRAEGMDMRLMDETGKTVNVNLKSGEDVVISDARIQKLMVSGELIPAEYALEQNYPNPFNPSTVIEFSLPENVGNVKLSIYNTLGEKVAELVNTSLIAGKYSYTWNAQNLATGMYIYELRTDKFVSVKKMLLLK